MFSLRPRPPADLRGDSVGRLMVRLAVPAITAQLINALYNMVDRMYIGNLPGDEGVRSLGALGVCLPLIMIVSAFGTMIGAGGSALAAIKLGGGDREGAEDILGNCLPLLVGFSVVILAVCQIFCRDLLYLVGATDSIIEPAVAYFRTYLAGTLPVLLVLGLNAFINTQGLAVMSMLTVLLGAVTNIVLDPILIYGMGMGVRGAAIATVISQCLSAVWVMVFLCGRRTRLKLRLSRMRPRWSRIGPVLALGVSPFIMNATESLVGIVINMSLKAVSPDMAAAERAIGAYSILASVMQLLLLPLVGLGQSVQPILSFNYGAGQFDRVKKTFTLFLRSSLTFTAVLWSLVMLFPGLFVRMFSSDAVLRRRAGAEGVHAHGPAARHSDRLSANLCRDGAGGDFAVSRPAAQGLAADPAGFGFLPAVGRGRCLRRRAGCGFSGGGGNRAGLRPVPAAAFFGCRRHKKAVPKHYRIRGARLNLKILETWKFHQLFREFSTPYIQEGKVAMKQLSDIEIAQSVPPLPVAQIAAGLGLSEDEIEFYGRYKAKVALSAAERLRDRPDGKLVLVTAITPTPAGEGKTTTTVGLGDALRRRGKKAVLALREPSLGPVFGIKGGAAGGGWAQVIPMEDINLHFTGDMHAIGAANNLLAAMLDNHIHQGNGLGIDVRRITWKRCVDMNDRQLRQVVDGLGGRMCGVPREDGFDITVASEIMAILCLSSGIRDLKERLARIVVGYTRDDRPVTAGDLKAAGAMAALLKDAIKPNLVQTLEHTPAFVHGGPFANIAHGCNSVTATRMALKLGEIVVTEAGFGADLGAEKFLDIKCRKAGLRPDAVVVVATVRALKHHGGAAKGTLEQEDLAALERGLPNLLAHLENITVRFGLPAVVAINRFPADTEAELRLVRERCAALGVRVALSEVWAKGGEGGLELADEVLALTEQPSSFRLLYEDALPLREKIETVVRDIYGGDGVELLPAAARELERLHALGFGGLPVCIAKTQYSLSDNPALLGRPEHFRVTVKQVRLSAGAGFVVVLTGDIMTMPGLPKVPAAETIDVDDDGRIHGLF